MCDRREEIVRFVAERRGVSFVELENYIGRFMECQGDMLIELQPNVVLWTHVNEAFADMVMGLVHDGLLEMKPTSLTVYLIDGRVPLMPIAKRIPKKGYAKEHWLPVVFNASKNRMERSS